MEKVLNRLGELFQPVPNNKVALGDGSWLQWHRFAMLLALFILVLFPGVLFGSRTFFFRDFGIFGYPLAHYHRECFWRGELPLWNNLSNCGLPYLAQWNTLTLYPLSLVYLILPLPWSLGLFCLLHLFLAGMGMYVLAYRWTNNCSAAAVAGIAFAFNGLTLNCLMWPNNIAGIAWMPWVIWAVERGCRKGGRSLLLASILSAVQVLAGSPEIILFTDLIAAAFWVTALFSDQTPRSALLLRGFVIACLVGALTAVQMLPFLDLLAHSNRNPNFANDAWAIPGWGWINLIFPLFKCYQSPSGPCFQPKQGWTSSYYPGIIVVCLALLCFPLKVRKRATLLWAIALAGLLMALGDAGYLFAGFRKLLPSLGMMRFPVKFIVLPVFALPFLAAFVLAKLSETRHVPEALKSTNRWLCIIPAALALGIAAALLYSRQDPRTFLSAGMLIENAGLRLVWLSLAVVILYLLSRTDFPKKREILQLALVLCVGLDAWTHAPNQNPTISPAMYAPNVVARELNIGSPTEAPRAFTSQTTHDVIYGAMIADAEKDFTGRRYNFFGNLNLLEHVPIVDGFYSLYLPEQRELWLNTFFATNFPAALGDFLSISRISTNVFDWQPRPSALPLITSGVKPVFEQPKLTISFLMSSDFDPRRFVALPLEARDVLKATNGIQARIVGSSISSSRIEAQVEASEPALVVISQSFYHRWHAYVNGQPVKIWQANHAFQALEVPAGNSQVKLVYEDPALQMGAVISGLALLGCIGAWFFISKRIGPAQSEAPMT